MVQAHEVKDELEQRFEAGADWLEQAGILNSIQNLKAIEFFDCDLPDVEMSEWLTKEHKVATIPASVFYGNGENIKYLRFCFAKSTETMEKAAELLCKI